MVNAGLIIVAFVSAAFAGCHIALSQNYKKKWKDLQGKYDKRCEELEAEKTKIKDIEQYLKYTQGVLFWGRYNLSVKEISSTEMAVVGKTSKSPEEMVVKIFHFDPKDPSDREFAIREAEELIEIIQKF